jgi:anthranilate phosphoribosyltransferase
MKDILHQLVQGHPLTAQQAETAFAHIMSGQADPHQTAALLTLLAAREPTVDELVGAATVMRRHVLPIPVAPELRDAVIDTCGTGGVGSRLFNVSTTAAIVTAACGVPVAKHGNRSFTSRSGSSDVLRLLGVNIETTPAQAGRCLAEAGICFAFAPLHHPAMRHVAPIRAALGFSTVFNILGPLTNPAGARRQLIGVRSPQLADKLLQVLVRLGVKRAMLVTGYDSDNSPLCELSISGPTHAAMFDGTETHTGTFQPEEVGFSTSSSAALEIDRPEDSAKLIQQVLAGQPGPARDIVLLNTAAALWIAGKSPDLAAAIPLAQSAIDSGAAHQTLRNLAACSHLP